ncbi:triadin-like, partial [Thunnus maccoyii]|uniref:triadin-like n=1 Tax=Thunnus maccoyii TaxID=8240 RepID=UPI001C4D9D85
MTETVEARSSTTTTTMVIDTKNGDAVSPLTRTSKKTFIDDLYSTFSSPLAWILVLALVITWSCVFVIMFDLMDYKTFSGGLTKIGSDPVHAVNYALEETTNMFSAILKFAANLVAPEEDDGNLYAVRKKGEFLPSRSKVIGMQAKTQPVVEVAEDEEEEGQEGDEMEAAGEEEDEYAEEEEELEDEEEYDEDEYDEEYDEEDEYEEEEYEEEEYDE